MINYDAPVTPEKALGKDVIPPQEFGDGVYAVHALSNAPVNGEILPPASQDFTEKLASWRPTVHWALGGVVPAHTELDWDERELAVVTPVKHLLPQLVNINPYDSFSLGSVSLTENFFLLHPANKPVAAGTGGSIKVPYPEGLSLSEAVAQFIAARNGLTSKFTPGSSTGVEPVTAVTADETKAYKDFNSLDQFKFLLDRLDYLSYGSHLESVKGWAFRFGVIDQALISLGGILETSKIKSWSYPEDRIKIALIKHHLIVLTQSIQRSTMRESAKTDFAQMTKKLQEMINILDENVEKKSQPSEKTAADLQLFTEIEYIFEGMTKTELQFFVRSNPTLFNEQLIRLLLDKA